MVSLISSLVCANLLIAKDGLLASQINCVFLTLLKEPSSSFMVDVPFIQSLTVEDCQVLCAGCLIISFTAAVTSFSKEPTP
jgi:hypothetical protein